MKKLYSKLGHHRIQNKLSHRKMVVLYIFLLLIFSSISIDAKENVSTESTPEENATAIMVVSDSTVVYNLNVISNAKKAKQEDTVNQKTVVFVSQDAVIYNADTISNAEIVQLESSQENNFHDRKIRIVQKKPFVAKPEKLKQQNDTSFFINTSKDSSVISQNTKENAVFSQVNSQIFFKVVKNSAVAVHTIVLEEQDVKISYRNPYFAISYFSGKYSVRPPTFFS